MIGAVGIGHVVLGEGDERCDPRPLLRVRKNKKYMGLQDDLAVVAAGRALDAAGLAGASLGPGCGLYLAVGYIPFFQKDFERVLEHSVVDGAFSMERFAAGGYGKANPLLTFRCLPNMPAYHVSTNFDVQGPYLVTYPTGGQLYTALEEAVAHLREGRVERALVGGVACQRNFLVEHHLARTGADPRLARDAAAFVVLERDPETPVARLEQLEQRYEPFDPEREVPPRREVVVVDGVSHAVPEELGPGSPLVALSRALAEGARDTQLRLDARDGTRSSMRWLA